MSNVSVETQEDSEEEFTPKSFIIFCLDDDGNVAFETSWGDTIEDIKKFAVLLSKVNDGQFEKMILEQLKIQSKEKVNGSKQYYAFNKSYKELQKPTDLDIDPTNVELN